MKNELGVGRERRRFSLFSTFPLTKTFFVFFKTFIVGDL